MELLLEANGITRYFGGFPALQDVSFDVKQGEIFGLIGPNGAGKTTLLNVINGVFPPSSGKLLLKGRVVSGLKPHRICQLGISRVLQTPRSFMSMTVLENVAVGAVFGDGDKHKGGSPMARAEQMLRFMGLDHKGSLPIERLNLQEKKMVEMAKGLATRPEILLVDEIMGGLNPAEVEDCMRLLKRIRDELGVTIIWIEHVMKAIMGIAERVMVLNYGQVIAMGTPAQVAHDQKVIDAYLGGTLGGTLAG